MDSLKKTFKALLGFLAYSAGLHRSVLRDRAVIIAFHRISRSSGRTSLDCPPEVFARLCGFFKKNFSVMPLSELIRRLNENEPIGGALTITFDDGYRDNFEVAAPILQKHGLPATFFVATNFIGSETVPFWDADEGVESQWMTWEDVGRLRDMGFDIGGHTMNHADLAALELDEASREIVGCRDALEDRLDAEILHFAYPFGGVDNVSPAVTRLVASSGFTCCLSCHGGIVAAGDNAFELPREPINSWVASPYQYGFELLTKAMEARR